jgi:3-oxoacyl-[acyl-carrier-protein] synthase III|tara:strand:+ start:7201 stop:8223 length:1023 start_codon:yes stop_codon:yes gene_type:complete
MSLKFNQDTRNARILSVGAYRPPRVVPNSEIIERIDSTDEWIQQRTGIQSRHFADADESLIDMAEKSANIAIARAGLKNEDIDAVIFATISYPYQAPSAASELIVRLGNPSAAAFDISAACAGFCYGVALANDLVRNKTAKNVLVMGAEKLSDFTDPDDRATAFIFADGAGSVVIGPSSDIGIGPTIWGAAAESREAILLEPSYLEFKNNPGKLDIGWPNISQQGQSVYRWAVYGMPPVALRALEAAGLTPETLDVFIPHQANDRIIEALVKSIKLPDSVVVAHDIRTSGNTSSASIPLAMDALLAERPELYGKSALLIGFGAGLVYAGQVVELPSKPNN